MNDDKEQQAPAADQFTSSLNSMMNRRINYIRKELHLRKLAILDIHQQIIKMHGELRLKTGNIVIFCMITYLVITFLAMNRITIMMPMWVCDGQNYAIC
jgi:hypothetical protein